MNESGRKIVELPGMITVRQLATLIQASPIDIIKQLMSNGVMANINQQLDFDTAAIVVQELGFEAKAEIVITPEEAASAAAPAATAPEWRRVIGAEADKDLVIRPPVAAS